MCKDGKCQERAGQTRNAVISLGTAARELAKLAEHPYMVVKTPLYIAHVPADPELLVTPGLAVIMEVYPTTNDAEIARKADRYTIEATRRKPEVIRMLELMFGLSPAPDASRKTEETLASIETSDRIADLTPANSF